MQGCLTRCGTFPGGWTEVCESDSHLRQAARLELGEDELAVVVYLKRPGAQHVLRDGVADEPSSHARGHLVAGHGVVPTRRLHPQRRPHLQEAFACGGGGRDELNSMKGNKLTDDSGLFLNPCAGINTILGLMVGNRCQPE